MPKIEKAEIKSLEEALKEHFISYGNIKSLLVRIDPIKLLPFAFIAFENPEDTRNAILQGN